MLIDKSISTLVKKANTFIKNTERQSGPDNISVISEIGINHGGSLKLAKKMIDVADHCGSDFVKFQKRFPDIAVPDHKKNDMRQTPKGKMKYIDYKHEIELSWKEFKEINEYCESKSIGWFSSVWDLPSVEFMQEFTDIGKIPSPHLTNDPVLKATRESFDEMIISTGMSTQDQIDHAVDVSDPDILMHSISSYPTKIENVNMNYLRFLKEKFPSKQVGYSGHELELETGSVAVALGADWIERHIALDKKLWGSDQSLSLEPQELKRFVRIVRNSEKCIGNKKPRNLLECEKDKKKSLRKNE